MGLLNRHREPEAVLKAFIRSLHGGYEPTCRIELLYQGGLTEQDSGRLRFISPCYAIAWPVAQYSLEDFAGRLLEGDPNLARSLEQDPGESAW